MPLLHLAFQEGFDNDSVTVEIGGREVFRKNPVKTRLQTGYADSYELEVEHGPVVVNVRIESRNLTAALELNVEGPMFIGISVRHDNVVYKVSGEPFGYL